MLGFQERLKIISKFFSIEAPWYPGEHQNGFEGTCRVYCQSPRCYHPVGCSSQVWSVSVWIEPTNPFPPCQILSECWICSLSAPCFVSWHQRDGIICKTCCLYDPYSMIEETTKQVSVFVPGAPWNCSVARVSRNAGGSALHRLKWPQNQVQTCEIVQITWP